MLEDKYSRKSENLVSLSGYVIVSIEFIPGKLNPSNVYLNKPCTTLICVMEIQSFINRFKPLEQ